MSDQGVNYASKTSYVSIKLYNISAFDILIIYIYIFAPIFTQINKPKIYNKFKPDTLKSLLNGLHDLSAHENDE